MASPVALQQTAAGSGWVHSPSSHPEHPEKWAGAVSPLLSQDTTGCGDPALLILSTSTWLSTLLVVHSICPVLIATAPGTGAQFCFQPGCIVTDVTAQLPGRQLLLQQPTYKCKPRVATCMQRLSKRMLPSCPWEKADFELHVSRSGRLLGPVLRRNR